MKKKFLNRFFLSAFLLCLSSYCFAQLEIKTKGSLYGLINKKTKAWVVPPTYKNINVVPWIKKDTFYCYQAQTKKGSLLLDRNGKPIPGAAFKTIEYLHYKKFFRVETPKGNAFYELGKGINTEIGYFEETRSEQYYSISRHFFMHQKGKWAIMDVRSLAKPFWYYDDVTFINGFTNKGGRIFMTKEGKKYGIADSIGTPLVKPVYDSLEVLYSLGFDPPVHTYIAARQDGKWGIVNVQGTVTAPFQFDSLYTKRYMSSVLNGSVPVLPAKMGAWWGVIDTSGKFVVVREYDHVPVIGDDRLVILIKNHKIGIVDFHGRTVFPFLYPNLEKTSYYTHNAKLFPNYLFSTHTNPASTTDTIAAWGLCDSLGKIIRPANARVIRLRGKYTGSDPDLADYDDSTFIGWLWNEGGCKFKSITESDSVFVEDESIGHFTIRYAYGDGFAGGKTGIIDRNGKAIVPVKYEEVILPCIRINNYGEYLGLNYVSLSKPSRFLQEEYKVYTEYAIIAKLNGKWGATDWHGKQVVPFEFDSVKIETTGANYFDMNDSMLKAHDLTRQVYRVYKNGMSGFYSPSGKELLHPHERFSEIASTTLCLKGQTFSLHEVSPKTVSNFNVVRKDFRHEKYKVRRAVYAIDPYTAEGVETHDTVEYVLTNGGKLNLLNSSTYTMLFKEWADDLILKATDDSSRPVKIVQWSNYKSTLGGSGLREEDVVGPGRNYDPLKDEIYFLGTGTCDKNLFVKQQGKWFLFDMEESKIVNAGSGFDSVSLATREFTAYKNGKFEKFPYSHKTPFHIELDMEWSPFLSESYPSLVARNVTAEYKEVNYKRREFRFDEMGYELPDTLIDAKAMIPLVQSAEFNLYDAQRKPKFAAWANEILLPTDTWENRFSVMDTGSVNFDPVKFGEGNDILKTEEYKQSIALKYGKIWKLVSWNDPSKHIDGLESVKFHDGHWEVSKAGKTLYYTIDGLNPAEGK